MAPAHPPLAYPNYASGMENISAYAGGVGPLRPAPSHSIYSFHDGLELCFARELAPAHRPLAYPIYASGMENISAYAGGLAPLDLPLPIGHLTLPNKSAEVGWGRTSLLTWHERNYSHVPHSRDALTCAKGAKEYRM